MKKVSLVLVLATVLSSTAWAADCRPPDAPRKMPDGATAKKAEMLSFKKLVDQYNTETTAYLACIKGEHDAQLAKYPKADDELKKNFMESYQRKNDAAVDVAEQFVGKFNEELRAYKAAQPAK